MSKTVYGSILDATEDIICHQVNCRGVMGAGVAKVLCQRWPMIKHQYQWFCKTQFHDRPQDLLGKVQIVDVAPDKQVANIFGQLDFGRNSHKKYTDYTALTNAFHTIRNTYAGKSLAFPYGFGCGLANGDWAVVSKMIEMYFGDMDVTIYRLTETAA